MQPAIVSIYPWADFMPGSGTGHLMCSIKFNVKVSDISINDITLVNDKNKKHIHDISIIDGYQYEHRGNEIIIRHGPQWAGCKMTVRVTLKHENKDYILVSEQKSVASVC